MDPRKIIVMENKLQKQLERWRMRHAVGMRLKVLETELDQARELVRALRRATTRAAERTARLRRPTATRWWAGLARKRAQKLAAATMDHQVQADDLRTAERQLELLEYEREVLSAQQIAARSEYRALRRSLREETLCLRDTEWEELQRLLRAIAQKETLLREIDEAVDYAGKLRKRINSAHKYLDTHVKMRMHRTKGRKRAPVAVLSDERMARFQQLLATVHSAHGRFEAELRDVYEAQLRCRTRADRQVEEAVGAFRSFLTPKVHPDYLRNNRLPRQLTTLKNAVLGLSRSLRSDKLQLEQELVALELAESDAWRAVA